MKLYLVTLRGFSYSYNSTIYGKSYVIANNAEEAYQKVKTYLISHDLGDSKDRELDNVALIAEDAGYPDCQTMLFL